MTKLYALTRDRYSLMSSTTHFTDKNTALRSTGLVQPNTGTTITVTNGEYSIDGGPWTSLPGLVNNLQVVEAHHTSADAPDSITTTTVFIGDSTVLSADFVSTTEAANSMPDAFFFTTQIDVARNATNVTSDSVAITGTNVDAPISVSVDSEYSIGGAAFTSVVGTIAPGESVVVRHDASALGGTDTVTTLTIGGVDGTFTSTTVANIVPVAVNDSATLDVTVAASISLDVTANDSDADGNIERATVVIVDHPVNGFITGVDDVTGVVTYTPTPGVFGVDSYTYTIDDNEGGTSLAATVTIDVPDPDAVGGGMPDDARLVFTLGTLIEFVDPVDGDGSWFFMAGGGGYTAIESFNGIQLGTEQPASGSHSGEPDGTERKNIDNPWFFFSNTGMHQTTSKVTIFRPQATPQAWTLPAGVLPGMILTLSRWVPVHIQVAQRVLLR